MDRLEDLEKRVAAVESRGGSVLAEKLGGGAGWWMVG